MPTGFRQSSKGGRESRAGSPCIVDSVAAKSLTERDTVPPGSSPSFVLPIPHFLAGERLSDQFHRMQSLPLRKPTTEHSPPWTVTSPRRARGVHRGGERAFGTLLCWPWRAHCTALRRHQKSTGKKVSVDRLLPWLSFPAFASQKSACWTRTRSTRSSPRLLPRRISGVAKPRARLSCLRWLDDR